MVSNRGGGRGGAQKRKRAGGRGFDHGHKHKKRNLDGDGSQPQHVSDRRNLPEVQPSYLKDSVLPKPFSEEEIAQEERRPKHKVAVLIGYSGTGYRGMQIIRTEKTIEGDLFTAFVAAGAISKANANDHKKSALVRCARTDKGVHAAGNVISLKLIVEEKDIIEKINAQLSPQIRIWDIIRTTNSFSAYGACDSRWYEYLIPTHAFLPPHHASLFGRRLVELADEVGDRDGYESRQGDMLNFWKEVDDKEVAPVLASLDPKIRDRVTAALYAEDEKVDTANPAVSTENPKESIEAVVEAVPKAVTEGEPSAAGEQASEVATNENADNQIPAEDQSTGVERLEPAEKRELEAAVKKLKAIYMTAKRAYRITPERLARIQPVLDQYVGTQNFHNYTVEKTFKDPASKRVIKSFKLDTTPKIINGTEWLSMKVHGQSFMMHQIRKMVSMMSLIVRCGCPAERIKQTFGPEIYSIPKVPGLGLLLEAPVFGSYNDGPATKYERPTIDFSRYEKPMNEFKDREIYQRIFREEEESNAFHVFYANVDSVKDSYFLYLTSMGHEAVSKYKMARTDSKSAPQQEESDADGEGGEG